MRVHLSFLIGVLSASPVFAQAGEDMLRAGYGLRRKGEFGLAALALDKAMEQLPGGAQRRAVGLELAEIYKADGKPGHALTLFRRNRDVPHEIDLLLELGRAEEARTAAQLVGYPRGQALAEAKLGNIDQAIRLLAANNLKQEQAQVLMEVRRYREAADLYRELEEPYKLAQALEKGRGGRTQLRAAYDEAREHVMFTIRHEVLPAVKEAKGNFKSAPDGVTRERARFEQARVYGVAADAFERLAIVYDRTGRKGGAKFLDKSIRFVELQQETLRDEQDGELDRFGQRLVETQQLAERVRELRELKGKM